MIERLTPKTPERVDTPTVGFETYRTMCDSVDFFRKLGVQNSDQYEAAIQDNRTVFLNDGEVRHPLAVPVEFEDRYSVSRCQEMTGSQNVHLLAMPVGILLDTMHDGRRLTVEGGRIEEGTSIVIEDYDGYSKEERMSLAQTTGLLLGNLMPGEFVDPRIQDKTDQTAWMGIYKLTFDSEKSEHEILKEGSVEQRIDATWNRFREENNLPELPGDDYSGIFMFSGEQLKEAKEVRDALWKISEVGFDGNLGAYHPMSMAVTKNFFDEHIIAPSTYVSAWYENGEPQCFGFFAPNMEHNEWLNSESTTVKEINDQAAVNDDLIVHFFELISKAERGQQLSPRILTFLENIASNISKRTQIIFECPTLSARYVPTISQLTVENNPSVRLVEQVKKLSTLNYSFLKKT